MPTSYFWAPNIEAVAAGLDPATKGFFSSGCEKITENQEKVRRFVLYILAVIINIENLTFFFVVEDTAKE